MAAPIVPPVVDVFNLYDDQRAENDMAVKLANTVTCGHQPHPNQHWSNTSNFNITKTRNRKLIWALHSLQTHFRAPINTVTLEAALTMHMAETLGPEQRDAFAFHVWGRNGPFDIDDTRFRAPAPDGTLHPGDQCLPLVEPQTAPDGTLRYGRVWERLRRSVWAFHPVLMMNKWVYICFRITNREEDGIPVMTTRTNNQLLKAEATLVRCGR
ncbi:hypothetical protein F4778DRAFT_161020 [Xylariomycetidae sp. FL2044]|nr:hypothetical protein F4778DRAFT_161020 [Xylariomycetidae sp. FL2044]